MKSVEIVEKGCVCVCVCEERKAKLERNFPEFSLNLHEHMVFRYILYLPCAPTGWLLFSVFYMN